MKIIRISFIGAGLMAGEHLKAFIDIPFVEIRGIYSRSRSRAEALATKYTIPNVCDSIDDLYATTQADLLIIAVSEMAVNMVCMSAFKYPWKILVEKPAGFNLTDALEIAAEAERAKANAFVALNRRHYSSTRRVLKDLENIWEQRLVQVLDQENPQVALDGGQPPLVVENWMYANSIHLIDYLMLFCRGSVVAVERVVKWTPLEPRYVVAKVTFSSGDLGLYQSVWNAPGPWSVAVNTQSKRWELRPLEQLSVQNYKSRRTEAITVHDWDTNFKPGIRLQAEEAVRAVSGELHHLPSLKDGLATMKLVHQIYEQ